MESSLIGRNHRWLENFFQSWQQDGLRNRAGVETISSFFAFLTPQGCSEHLKPSWKDLIYFLWRNCASWKCSWKCFAFQNILSLPLLNITTWTCSSFGFFASIFTLADTTRNKQEIFVVHNKRLCMHWLDLWSL